MITEALRRDYQERLTQLENFLDFAIDVSEATMGKKDISWKLARTHQLYNRLTVTTLSFIRLLPRNRYFTVEWEFWDFFSIASLARNLIENYHLLFYIGVDPVSPEETELRLSVFQYHLNSERHKLYKESGTPEDSLTDFSINLPLARTELENNPVFKTLDKSRQGLILKGNEFMCVAWKDLLKKMPFATDETIPMFRFLSAQTHSAPLSFYTQSDERGRGLENESEVKYTILCIDLVTKYLTAAILDIVNLFPDCGAKLNKDKLIFIEQHFLTYSNNH
jgi:hypothetical protein